MKGRFRKSSRKDTNIVEQVHPDAKVEYDRVCNDKSEEEKTADEAHNDSDVLLEDGEEGNQEWQIWLYWHYSSSCIFWTIDY